MVIFTNKLLINLKHISEATHFQLPNVHEAANSLTAIKKSNIEQTMTPIWTLCFFIAYSIEINAQNELAIIDANSGLRLAVLNKNFPLLKILLPNQSNSERGIEVEFPEHVTGLNEQTKTVEHLYLVTRGNLNNRTLPVWKMENNTLIYETELNGNIKMIARAQLESNGVRYSYKFTNHSNISYQNFQAVTCVKLYSAFSDTLLKRTYVHHTNGFDLLASETPERLTMPLRKWLPCRYLVSYNWPIASKRIEKDEDSITRYYKSRRADQPFIATLSHDKNWVAATYTSETGNLWTNPERSCQHADPSISLNTNETKTLRLTTFLYKGTLDSLLKYVAREKQRKQD